MSFLELAPLPGAVPCARLHAISVLCEWGLRDLADETFPGTDAFASWLSALAAADR